MAQSTECLNPSTSTDHRSLDEMTNSTDQSKQSVGTPLLQVGISGIEPGWVADVYSILNDITFAMRCANHYAAIAHQHESGNADPDQEQRDGERFIASAMWNAAVVAYRRGFNSGRGHLVKGGKRPRLSDPLIALLTDEQKAVHTGALDQANQHVAHRVSELEQIITMAALNPPEAPHGIAAVSLMRVHFIGPMAEFADTFAEICALFIAELQQEYNRGLDELRVRVTDTADIDALYAHAEAEAQQIQAQPGTA